MAQLADWLRLGWLSTASRARIRRDIWFKLWGPDKPAHRCAYAWVAEALRSVMPQLQTICVPTAEIGIDTLEDRLRKAARTELDDA